MRMVRSAGLYAWLLSDVAIAQNSSASPVFEPPAEYPKAISFFAPLFFPKILQDEYRLKEYICSNGFASFRRTYGDLIAVDAMFDCALRLSWSNVYEALFISFVCTMEHRNFGVKLPVIGPLLWLPLTSEFPDEFRQRVRALPSRLYGDTPSDPAGDRDKLQHFFGSAFLTYMFESRCAAGRVGMFIEWGEDKFIVDGALDQRDIRANIQGQNFGARLLSDGSVLPSEFLRKVERAFDVERGCVRGELQNSFGSLMEER